MKPAPHHVGEILDLLRKAHGPRPPRTWGRGIDVLVDTILSQNTTNKNSDAAYRQLRRELPTWNAVADAPVEQVERHIRVAGLSRLKAPRIQAILRHLRAEPGRRGRISLEFLRKLPPDQAAEYLRQFSGIGPKTIACLLLFAFGMPVFPVDTHIHRIARRLGWIGPKISPEKAHALLEPAIRPHDRYEMHVLLITHGRQICKARTPQCLGCLLRPLCPYGAARPPTPLAKSDPPLRISPLPRYNTLLRRTRQRSSVG